MNQHNELLRRARGQKLVDRLVEGTLIAATLICLGMMIGTAAFGNP